MDVIRTTGAHYAENRLGYFDFLFVMKGAKLPLDRLAKVTARLLDGLERACLDASDTPTWSPIPGPPTGPGRRKDG
jgi:hypothetical protein